MKGWRGFKCTTALVVLAALVLAFAGCLGPAPASSATNRPPSEPSVRTPPNNGEDVSVTPLLSWTCSDPDGDHVTYEVYFGTDKNDLKLLASTSSTSYRITDPLKKDTEYYWKVVAKDARGATRESDIWSFKTASLRIIRISDERFFHSNDASLSPAVGPDGCIYVCFDEGLIKFSQEFSETIEIKLSSPSHPTTSLTIDPQTGKVYLGVYGKCVIVYEGDSEWKEQTIEVAIHVSPIVFGEHVYVVDAVGKVYKMKKEDLTIVDPLKDLHMELAAVHPVVVDGNLVVVGEKQGKYEVHLVDTSSMESVWSTDVLKEGNILKYIAVDKDKRVYLGGNRKLLCLDLKTKDTWEFPLEGSDNSFLSSPVISRDGTVYVGVQRGDYSGVIYAIDPENKKEKWKKDLEGDIYFMSFVIGDTNVLYVAAENILLALNAKNGEEIDRIELGDFYVYSHPVLYKGKIFLAAMEEESGEYALFEIKALNDDLDDPSLAWPMFQKDQYHTGVR